MRRLIEHQVAVRAFGALIYFDNCLGASALGLFFIPLHFNQYLRVFNKYKARPPEMEVGLTVVVKSAL